MEHRKAIRNWSVEKLELLFGIYLTWQGVSILAFSRSGKDSPSFHYLVELSALVNVQPEWILAGLFVIPGPLVIFGKTRRLGLLLAAMFMFIHAVGTARSVYLLSDGAISAPNTYAFIAILAAWLYSTERYAR